MEVSAAPEMRDYWGRDSIWRDANLNGINIGVIINVEKGNKSKWALRSWYVEYDGLSGELVARKWRIILSLNSAIILQMGRGAVIFRFFA